MSSALCLCLFYVSVWFFREREFKERIAVCLRCVGFCFWEEACQSSIEKDFKGFPEPGPGFQLFSHELLSFAQPVEFFVQFVDFPVQFIDFLFGGQTHFLGQSGQAVLGPVEFILEF